ncbi:glycoside hydrolase family 35 protein [Granulicella tundricola]|uniref:Beta-galactosidase n=1 Tax=Granulicella tundricola (strain ATCC BAA-1859 / DSM 23138 / MP5ACTX9) TaxID=1198114 RepID=E8X6Y0_GRATM|nr:beta-galactosidase family protein [Granulicella tundricola]ADW71089.1 glycoside hydrolase family 35 [Granulicella tundricola MP5ACTX9]
MRSLITAALLLASAPLLAQPPATHRLTTDPQHFLLDGQPFQLISGEMHYPRIPRAAWRDRLRKARAMGLNAVTVYAFWNFHEEEEGHFDFTGQRDIAEFVRIAQQEGLFVILRPGPYVCAEWDLGGYPSWLLKSPAVNLRSLDSRYIAAADKWMKALGQQLAPLQAAKGGPILAVQVENEYGSFPDSAQPNAQAYLDRVHQMVLDAGFKDSLLYTGDGADVLARGTFADLTAGIDYGTGDSARSIALYKKFRPNTNIYTAEYWDGWFDHWGAKHEVVDASIHLKEVHDVLTSGGSISLYMLHGGTSFGWMNGANIDHNHYEPDVTSYDYDAPIDEAGQLRPEYFAMRKVIAEATGHPAPPLAPTTPLATIPTIHLTQAQPLWSTLPKPTLSRTTRTMEDIGQSYGYILYRTTLKGPITGTLKLDRLHSYARIYLDGKLVGTLDRRLDQDHIDLQINKPTQLDILVENTGRVNFTEAIRTEQAGITHQVLLNGTPVENWQIYSLPFESIPTTGFSTKPCEGPCLYHATFNLTTPVDTYLDVHTLSKGNVWVNGHNLGRFWKIGPLGTLYLPSSWLKPGPNKIEVLELDGKPSLEIEGIDHALLDLPPS